jgi:hypothetical protein
VNLPLNCADLGPTAATGCRKAAEAPDAPFALLLPAAAALVVLARARLSKRSQARRAF